MPSLPRSPFGRRSARRSTAERVPERDEPRVEIVESPGLRWINIERPRAVDLAWLAAARSAYAEAGRDLAWVVVTRHGWWDPRSGLRRRWKRIRA